MKPATRFGLLALVVAACSLLGSAASAATACPKAPRGHEELRTLQCVLGSDQPVHIIYLHGIRASAPGFSKDFRKALCEYLAGCSGVRTSRRYLDMGFMPVYATSLGDKVWNEKSWKGSRPFVEHYVYDRVGAKPIIVDEINYWPLLLAFKCQNLVRDDASLAGPDKADIEICAGRPKPTTRDKKAPEPDPEPYLYPWIDPDAEATLLKTRPPKGGGALINKMLKTSILTWGISDAVIALGPMKAYTRLAVWCAFEEIEVFDPQAAPTTAQAPARSCKAKDNALPRTDKQFLVISESLGSFVLLDAFAKATYLSKHRDTDRRPTEPATADEGSALQFIVNRSDNIYFFANQFALLELARVEGLYSPNEGRSGPEVVTVDTLRDWTFDTLRNWASADGGAGHKQLVAFNDPSDILTYRVPNFCKDREVPPPCNAIIQNIDVKNSFRWLGLFERPDYAHTWYSRNPQVLKVIFGAAPPPRPVR